jgi:hypothetical protein
VCLHVLLPIFVTIHDDVMTDMDMDDNGANSGPSLDFADLAKIRPVCVLRGSRYASVAAYFQFFGGYPVSGY